MNTITLNCIHAERVGFEHGADKDSPLIEWDGIQIHTFLSGVVVKFPDPNNMDSVIVGRMYC